MQLNPVYAIYETIDSMFEDGESYGMEDWSEEKQYAFKNYMMNYFSKTYVISEQIEYFNEEFDDEEDEGYEYEDKEGEEHKQLNPVYAIYETIDSMFENGENYGMEDWSEEKKNAFKKHMINYFSQTYVISEEIEYFNEEFDDEEEEEEEGDN